MRVNGRTASVGDSADPERDWIECDGRRVVPEPPVYWLVHKPRGVVTTRRDPQGRRTVLDLVDDPHRLFPVGRLDRDTEGLVLLTNDGALAQALLHPSLGNEREYRVTVSGRPTPETLRQLAEGVELEEGRTAPARVGAPRHDEARGRTTFTLVLREGRKRQIRRSCEALGHPVVRLVRTRMGPLRLGRLAPAAARPLRREERTALLEHARRLRAGHARSRARRSARKPAARK